MEKAINQIIDRESRGDIKPMGDAERSRVAL
jgi:hypothetical protein